MEQITKETNKIKVVLCNIRILGKDKQYYLNQLKEFSKLFNENKLRSIHFGKQDIRGGISITLINKKYCVPYQKFFSNKSEMLGFVCGFVCAMDTYKSNYSEFGGFLKWKTK